MLAEIIILPPLLVAAILALGIVTGYIAGEAHERLTGRLSVTAGTVSFLTALTLVMGRLRGDFPDHSVAGTWLESGHYRIGIEFDFSVPALGFSVLIATLSLLVLRFSINYMHREPGYHRFFLILSLFVGAMQLLALGGNAVLTFTGWELAGVTSYLLIAYAYDRPTATYNATRAFVTNRIGDAGFVLGVFLAFAWGGAIDWPSIVNTTRLDDWQTNALAGSFLLAAVAKSAQVPLTPWLARAMEGPTPSSAIFYGGLMVHAGVFLVLRLEPVFMHAPVAMNAMALVGLATALYGYYCGLTQSDVKSALIFSTMGQVGLMFLAAGLGWWTLALIHLCAHAVFRAYQFLSAPSLMHHVAGNPARQVPRWLGQRPTLYLASLQRQWLEPASDWLVTRPLQRLASDFNVFESQLIQRASGLPLPVEHTPPSERLPNAADPEVIRVSGLAGRVVAKLAEWLHWFEDRLILRGLGDDLIRIGRRFGMRLNRFDALLNQPRYLILFVLAVLLAVF